MKISEWCACQVDAVLGDRFPTIEDMKKLKYTTRVINEVRNNHLYVSKAVKCVLNVIQSFAVFEALPTTTCFDTSVHWRWRPWQISNKKVHTYVLQYQVILLCSLFMWLSAIRFMKTWQKVMVYYKELTCCR